MNPRRRTANCDVPMDEEEGPGPPRNTEGRTNAAHTLVQRKVGWSGGGGGWSVWLRWGRNIDQKRSALVGPKRTGDVVGGTPKIRSGRYLVAARLPPPPPLPRVVGSKLAPEHQRGNQHHNGRPASREGGMPRKTRRDLKPVSGQ